MRLAVFTSKYPARVSTFFERDMRALLEAGIEIDLFPIYPLDASMWDYSLYSENEQILPAERLHHLSLFQSLRQLRPYPLKKVVGFSRDVLKIGASAAQHGIGPVAKSGYVLAKSWAWARQHDRQYDHVLAYWGNYAATCAYEFHRLLDRPTPFSIWLHAGADLYDTPVYLKQKLLYTDKIITCCAFNKTYLAEHYPEIFPAISDKLTVCYHGLDFKEFVFQPVKPAPNRVVAVGRLASEKGFAYLLQAAHQLSKRGTQIELEIVGDGEEAGALKRLAKQLGISERVRFHGWLKFNEVRKVISDATLLVHPSDGLGDGLPNVIREAMALGTPVIASDIAGIHEALDNGHCGLLVPPRNINELTNAIETLLNDDSLRLTFANRARRRAEDKFDMWRNGQMLAEALRAAKRNPALDRPARKAKEIQSNVSATAQELV